MRAFIGVGLTPGSRAAIASALAPFRERGAGVSWVREENLHLTLKFLGEVPPGEADGIAEAMARACREIPPFDLRVEGAGGFPSLRAPRVLWVGIGEPLELVGKLQDNMETALAGAGFPREGRPFHPHVTVGRVKGSLPPGWGDRYAQALGGAHFGTVRATSATLYESRLSPAGATYVALREVPFGG